MRWAPLFALLAGCTFERLTFECTTDLQCSGNGGICADRACAFPAQDCSSRYRWDTSANAGRSGKCVPPGDDMSIADIATDGSPDLAGADFIERDLSSLDSTLAADMTQPVCTPAQRRCKPTDHAYEQVCDARGFWQDNACSTAVAPAWACTDLKGRCIDVAWTQWPYVSPSPSPSPQLTTISDPTGNGEDIVADGNTGLKWQQHMTMTTFAFSDAVNYCAALTYGGFSDWRLPTTVELLSIQDLARSTCSPGTPQVYDPFLAYTPPASYFWSSVPLFNSPMQYAWTVHTRGSEATPQTQTTTLYARCVR